MKSFKKIMTVLLAALMVLALPVMAYADDEEAATLDTTGATVYHARFGVQMTTADGITWMDRVGYFHQDLAETFTDAGVEAEFTDVDIKGNGTYTVSMTSSGIAGDLFTQLQVATDIPVVENSPVTFSNLIIKINDQLICTYETPFVDDDSYAHDLSCLIAFNHWRDYCNDDTSLVPVDCIPSSGDVTISMTFTVSGFDVDDPDAQPETEEETTAIVANGGVKPTSAYKPSTTAAESENNGLPTGAVVGIVVAVVVIIAAVIIVSVTKKKKNN